MRDLFSQSDQGEAAHRDKVSSSTGSTGRDGAHEANQLHASRKYAERLREEDPFLDNRLMLEMLKDSGHKVKDQEALLEAWKDSQANPTSRSQGGIKNLELALIRSLKVRAEAIQMNGWGPEGSSPVVWSQMVAFEDTEEQATMLEDLFLDLKASMGYAPHRVLSQIEAYIEKDVFWEDEETRDAETDLNLVNAFLRIRRRGVALYAQVVQLLDIKSRMAKLSNADLAKYITKGSVPSLMIDTNTLFLDALSEAEARVVSVSRAKFAKDPSYIALKNALEDVSPTRLRQAFADSAKGILAAKKSNKLIRKVSKLLEIPEESIKSMSHETLSRRLAERFYRSAASITPGDVSVADKARKWLKTKGQSFARGAGSSVASSIGLAFGYADMAHNKEQARMYSSLDEMFPSSSRSLVMSEKTGEVPLGSGVMSRSWTPSLWKAEVRKRIDSIIGFAQGSELVNGISEDKSEELVEAHFSRVVSSMSDPTEYLREWDRWFKRNEVITDARNVYDLLVLSSSVGFYVDGLFAISAGSSAIASVIPSSISSFAARRFPKLIRGAMKWSGKTMGFASLAFEVMRLWQEFYLLGSLGPKVWKFIYHAVNWPEGEVSRIKVTLGDDSGLVDESIARLQNIYKDMHYANHIDNYHDAIRQDLRDRSDKSMSLAFLATNRTYVGKKDPSIWYYYLGNASIADDE